MRTYKTNEDKLVQNNDGQHRELPRAPEDLVRITQWFSDFFEDL